MTDLKILYLSKNDEYCINQNRRYLRNALREHCQIEEYGAGYKHPTLSTRRSGIEMDLVKLEEVFEPDVILIFAIKNQVWTNYQKIKAPVAVIMTDPHGAREHRLNWINKDKIPMTLFRYIGGWKWWEERFFKDHKMRWLPHSCETDVFKVRELEKIYDFALVGRNHRSTYPMRYEIYHWLGYSAIKNPNPNYKIFWRKRHKRSWNMTPARRKELDVVMGEDFAKVLSQSKMFPTGSSVYKYALTRYCEVMGTGTPIASNETYGDEKLGFIRDHNYIHINRENFKEKIDYYLENYSEAQKIADRARKLMEDRHSMKIRAKELLGHLEELF